MNKPSTRYVLAEAGASVQFLIPPRAAPDGSLDLADFLLRAQAAMKDLVSAHAGRIDIVPDAVAACFPDPETRPRQVIGITVVRKQKGRVNRLEATFLAVAACIDVDSGLCSARVAHEGVDGGYAATAWAPFRDALSTVARISPARLAREAKDQKVRFMRFVDEVITAAVEEGACPLVIIDSSNAARLWPWLTDQKLDPGKIDIGEREWTQESWSGARIVRVRQDLAPDLGEEKWIDLAETWEADDRPKGSILAGDVDPVPAHKPGRRPVPGGRGGVWMRDLPFRWSESSSQGKAGPQLSQGGAASRQADVQGGQPVRAPGASEQRGGRCRARVRPQGCPHRPVAVAQSAGGGCRLAGPGRRPRPDCQDDRVPALRFRPYTANGRCCRPRFSSSASSGTM